MLKVYVTVRVSASSSVTSLMLTTANRGAAQAPTAAPVEDALHTPICPAVSPGIQLLDPAVLFATKVSGPTVATCPFFETLTSVMHSSVSPGKRPWPFYCA